MNIAQMWDMYLALENAYEDLEGSTAANTHLLNASQKNIWNQRIGGFIDDLYDGTTHSYPISFGVNLHEAQPGNWPLIGFIAADYMLLGFNGTFSSGLFPPILSAQVRSAALTSSILHKKVSTSMTSRMYYFNYQTSGGKRYWAEGTYYFSIVLEHLVPYYHALRANNFLPWSNPDGSISADPFEDPAFLNPVNWLADIATPDGKTPPIDDSIKLTIYSSNLLNWAPIYGNAQVGEKFASIVQNEFGRYPWLANVELAIPRLGSGGSYPANQVLGNAYTFTIDENSEQQQIIKYTDSQNRKHYIYLNGESHDAITRAEGHEQPDQNQLLYYVNEVNHLADAGYDSGGLFNNSTWNEYSHNNVIHHKYSPKGGLKSPISKPLLGRKESDHNNVERSYIEHSSYSANKVTILSGRVQLGIDDDGGLTFEYNRNVLFVRDKSYGGMTSPVYLVDLNSLKPRNHTDVSKYEWWMRYRSAADFTSNPSGTTGWNAAIRSTAENTHIFVSAVEFVPTTAEIINYYSYVQQGDVTATENVTLTNRSGIHFNTMGFIIPSASTGLSNVPVRLTSHHPTLPAGVWVNKISNDILDVIAMRGTHLLEHHLGFPVALNVPDADNFQITILASRNYGFARLVRSGGVWSLDSDYSVGIDPSTYSVAANASITLNNASLSSANQVHVHDNASVTLTGSGTISNKNGASEIAPEVFPAYPNPFNPVTLIPVQLNQASDIRMEVFDVIGRRVASLADRSFQAGRHKIQFDASRLSSGLYLIRTFINGNMHVQRVTLVK